MWRLAINYKQKIVILYFTEKKTFGFYCMKKYPGKKESIFEES